MSPAERHVSEGGPGLARDVDPSRRTMLAAERTWLAWWRSGIAAATAAIAVGGVVPHLVGGERAPYEVLGAGYAVLAAAVFIGGANRLRRMNEDLDRGTYTPVGGGWIVVLTVAGGVLALGTLAVIIVQP